MPVPPMSKGQLDHSELCVVVFRVGQSLLGLDCRAVREVLPPLHVTPLAGASGPIEGFVEIRGEIVSVVDLRPRVGGLADGFRRRTRLLHVRAGPGELALIVDQVVDVRAVATDGLRPAPIAGAGRGAWGWIEAPGCPLIQLLDADQILGGVESVPLPTGHPHAAIDR
jgi:purine-binding chemotaxis protein CheW